MFVRGFVGISQLFVGGIRGRSRFVQKGYGCWRARKAHVAGVVLRHVGI
jgi:hypothetical protein